MKLSPRFLKNFIKKLMWEKPWLFWPLQYSKIKKIVSEKNEKGIIIYPPTVDWSWMKQRPHQLLEGLSEKGFLCFYVNINAKSGRKGTLKKISNNLYVVGNAYVLTKIISPILFISWTDHYSILEHFQNPTIVYDYLDDLSVSADEVDKEKLTHHEYFLKNSDVVLVTADRLEKDAKRYNKEIVKLPNAGNYEDFHLVSKPKVPSDLQEIIALGKPIIGYYGALAKWFDYKLLKEVAQEKPNYEFVLIGPDYDD